MTNFLESVLSGCFDVPDRIVIHGEEGAGKSTWASSAPSPIFIDIEDGLARISCAKFPKARSLDDVMRSIGALYSEPHEYKTVVIDSLDALEKLIWIDVATKKGKENIEDIGFARGYTFALQTWREILEGLSALRDEKGMRVILICHSKIERFEAPDIDGYDRQTLALHKLASQLIVGWSDFVLYAGFKVFIKKGEDGKKTKGIGTGERIIKAAAKPSHVTKSRITLPDELPLDWNSFESCLNGK